VTVHRLLSTLEHGVRLWLRRLPQELTSLRPDFVLMHGMGSYTAVRVARLRRRLGPRCKLVFDSHANDVNSRNQLRAFYYGFYRAVLTPLFLNSADAIVAIDDNSKLFWYASAPCRRTALR
jgi:hypothetical protein